MTAAVPVRGPAPAVLAMIWADAASPPRRTESATKAGRVMVTVRGRSGSTDRAAAAQVTTVNPAAAASPAPHTRSSATRPALGGEKLCPRQCPATIFSPHGRLERRVRKAAQSPRNDRCRGDRSPHLRERGAHGRKPLAPRLL